MHHALNYLEKLQQNNNVMNLKTLLVSFKSFYIEELCISVCNKRQPLLFLETIAFVVV